MPEDYHQYDSEQHPPCMCGNCCRYRCIGFTCQFVSEEVRLEDFEAYGSIE